VLQWLADFVYDVFYVYVNILMAMLTDIYIYIYIYTFWGLCDVYMCLRIFFFFNFMMSKLYML
jgi:hypothetical protein